LSFIYIQTIYEHLKCGKLFRLLMDT